MGKQVKEWKPPSDAQAVETKEAKTVTWTPPADVVPVDEPVKKKESSLPDGNASSEPVAQPTSPSSQPTASEPEPRDAGGRLKQRASQYLSASQQSFSTNADKKRAELQAIVDADPTRTDWANTEMRNYLGESESKYNADLDKWMGRYTDQFVKEDFEENKETNPIKSLGKTAWVTLSKDLPANFYGAKALVGSAMKKMDEQVIKGAEKLGVKPLDESVAERAVSGVISVFENITGVKSGKNLGKDTTIADAKSTAILNDIRKSIELSGASEEQKKYLVNNLDKVQDGDFVDWMNYAASAIGQGVGQIPTSVLTKGSSSLVQQMGSIYMDSVRKIAQEEGLTIEEVIRQGRDDVVYPLIMGVGTGLLDAIGAKGVSGAVTKSMVLNGFRQRALGIAGASAKGGAIETATETVQTGLEQIGVNKATGKTWHETLKNFDWKPLKDAALQGGIAGFFLGGAGKGVSTSFEAIRPKAKVQTPEEAIKSTTESVNPSDPASVDRAAEIIQQKVESGDGKLSLSGERTEIEKGENLNTNETEIIGTGTESGTQPDTQINSRESTESTAGNDGFNDLRSGQNTNASTVDIETNKERVDTTQGSPSEVQSQQSELETMREKLLNSPDDLQWDGKKVTILSEEGAEMLRQYRALKDKTSSAGGEVSSEPKPNTDEKGRENQGQQDQMLTPEQVVRDEQPVSLNEEQEAWMYTLDEAADIGAAAEYEREFGEKPSIDELQAWRRAGKTSELNVSDVHGVAVERAIEDGSFINALNEGKITKDRAIEVINSAGIKVPSEIKNYEQTTQPPRPPATNPDVSSESDVRGLSDSGAVPPNRDTKNTIPDGVPGEQTRLGQRIEESSEPEAIKSKVKGRDTYTPRSIPKTNDEAKSLLSKMSDDEAETVIRDKSNSMEGGVRATLAANLYERYKGAGNNDRAADIAVWAAQNLTKAGQETAIAGKIWKSIMSSEDLTVLALEKQQAQQAAKVIAPLQEKLQVTKDQIDAQIRKAVTEQVEKRLQSARAITPETRKRISDAFDALKVKDIGGAANDITRVLGAAVWNGSIEAVKRAVLTGADIANAIQAGIDYIRDNFKSDWSEDEYRAAITPSVEQLVERAKVQRESIQDEKISTPKLSGKRKKEFIDKVVEEYNAKGKISDDKFDSLYADQLGIKPLTSAERQQIRDLAKIISEVENFKEDLKNNFTPENISRYKDLLKRAQKANRNLQEFANRNPSDIWTTLSTIMQGNILTPLSIIRNIYSNTAYQPLRFLSSAVAQPIDMMLTGIAKTGILGDNVSNLLGKDRTIDLVAAQRGYFEGGWNGLMEGLYQMASGSLVDDRNLREIQPSFDPLKALKRLGENRGTAQKINDAIEGTFGLPAEAMFRLLNLGDKPFRRAAEMARAYEIGSLKGLSGSDLMQFILLPDAESQVEIEQAGKDATFQNESTLATVVQQIVNMIITGAGKLPGIGGPARLLIKSQIPFIRTPANIMAETFNYALWPLTILHGTYQIAKGNKRAGSMLLGKAVVGSMITVVAHKLLELGLMTWDDREREGKPKERRSLQYDTEPPNSLNVSAIQRGLSGGAWEPQDQDVWVDYKNLGIQGIIMQTYANTWYRNTKEGKEPFNDLLSEAGLATMKIASSSLEQSFLQGTNTFLEAVKDPDGYAGTKWVINTTEAITSIAVPRSATATMQASDEFIRDTRDETLMAQLANTYKSKFLMGEDLPARVNLWGEKITGNPDGRDKYAYYLFDPTRFREADQDNYRYKIYSAWKDSKFDDEWLPSMPDRNLSIKGIKIKLTPQQYEQLSIEIGKARAHKVALYVGRKKKLDLERVKKAYQDGRDDGKRKFLATSGLNVMNKKALQKLAEN